MTQVREEIYFTKGRVIVRGNTVRQGEAKKAGYLLYYKPNIPIAVVEAKGNNHAVGAGMPQALEYAEILDIPFAFSCNGDAFLEHDRMALVEQLKIQLTASRATAEKLMAAVLSELVRNGNSCEQQEVRRPVIQGAKVVAV